MTAVLIPVPQSPIGTVELDANGQPTGRIIMAREWYRYLSLIQQAIGGTTNIFIEDSEGVPPFEQIFGETVSLVTSVLIDALGMAAQAQAEVANLQRRVSDLEFLTPGPPS